jgi:hypothetical protein
MQAEERILPYPQATSCDSEVDPLAWQPGLREARQGGSGFCRNKQPETVGPVSDYHGQSAGDAGGPRTGPGGPGENHWITLVVRSL